MEEDSLNVKQIVYYFQDLLMEKKIKTFTKFQSRFFQQFEFFRIKICSKFICRELKNIHAFLKIIQYHPKSYLLAQALKPLFEFLINNLFVSKIVYVADSNFLHIYRIKYKDLIEGCEGKKVFRYEGNTFVVPYKGKAEYIQKRRRLQLQLQPNSWVNNIVSRKILGKLRRSNLRWGGEILRAVDEHHDKADEFSRCLTEDYFNSDSEYLPKEIFEFEEDEDIPKWY